MARISRQARLWLVALMVAGPTLYGCGGDSQADHPPLPGGGPQLISAVDNTFRPESARVPAGTEVVWSNDGRNDHNIIPVEAGEWGVAREEFQAGDEYRYTFDEAGTYDYYCSLHGTAAAGMVGSIIVTG